MQECKKKVEVGLKKEWESQRTAAVEELENQHATATQVMGQAHRMASKTFQQYLENQGELQAKNEAALQVAEQRYNISIAAARQAKEAEAAKLHSRLQAQENARISSDERAAELVVLYR